MMKKILVISHQLSRTGAPIVLLDVIRICLEHGYYVNVITMMDGELHKELDDMGVRVKVQEYFFHEAEAFLAEVEPYDMVIANTLITYEAIHVLKYSKKPVLWWLHEGRQHFEYFKTVIPDFHKLPDHIHVFSVGHYVQKIIYELYQYKTGILHFYVEDVPAAVPLCREDLKVKFLTVGTYSKVKAQDILAQAIRQISQDDLKQMEFIFCGNDQMYDEDVYMSVKQLADDFENVTMIPAVSHEELLKIIDSCDCLVVPSRIEPMPTVAVESMMKEKPCLCTNVCGVAHYIKDGENGYLVLPEDVQALRKKIESIFNNRQELEMVGKEGRKIYEQYFSKEVIENQILGLIRQYCIA